MRWPTLATTRGRCKLGSATRTFSTRCAIPSWRPIVSRAFGGAEQYSRAVMSDAGEHGLASRSSSRAPDGVHRRVCQRLRHSCFYFLSALLRRVGVVICGSIHAPQLKSIIDRCADFPALVSSFTLSQRDAVTLLGSDPSDVPSVARPRPSDHRPGSSLTDGPCRADRRLVLSAAACAPAPATRPQQLAAAR
jgi:hypothetical protein